MNRMQCLLMSIGLTLVPTVLALAAPSQTPRPAVLILPGGEYSPFWKLDYRWLSELHGRGIDLDVKYQKDLVTRDVLAKYNVLVILNLPPFGEKTAAALDRYLQEGGGLFLMPNLCHYDGTLKGMKNWEAYLQRWGARIPLAHVHDLTAVATHPRNTRQFVYTDKVLPSPVSEGVKAIWFPGGEADDQAFGAYGHAIHVSSAWTSVVRGSDASFTKPMRMVGVSAEKDLLPDMFRRPDPTKPPTLFAIRKQGPGRLALVVSNPIYHLYGGSSWIHDRVMIDKGMAGRPTSFGKLFENTVRWLAEPSLASGKLGGYVQDPIQLKHPNKRKKPTEYFGQFDTYQNPTPPSRVFRGLIGARTAYSTGKGTVADYATAARAVGLDFVVFTEDLSKLTEAEHRKLEEECKRLTTKDLVLVPGIGLRNNIGNFMWGHGFGIPWFKPSQLTGPERDQLRSQCFDKDGKLTFSDEDAKNWLWKLYGVTGRNVGYYDFTKDPGVPVRNLRLFGILAVVTYRGGKLIEDLTDAYLDYVTDGCPPLACAVNVVYSPEELRRAVTQKQYLTHVGASSSAKIVPALQYGHQYGRPNVYLSSGPRIRSWAGTQRFSTYAGESYVTARRRARPELWVTSDVGLREIVIYTETRPYRRFLCNGAKDFHVTFEWGYDRHRELVAIVTDVKGGRAVSASRSLWSDTNYNGWCNDRQNGELWHGPGTVPGPRRPKFSVGPTWDGGPPPPAYGNFELGPAVRTKDRRQEGWYRLRGGRRMEGNQYPTCYDDTVANAACDNAHLYAPGVVANAYNTLGPIQPSRFFTAHQRRTQFLQRPAGVDLDWHAMYPERAGGTVALFEGTVTLKQDLDVQAVHYVSILPHSYPKDKSNIPLMAVNTGSGQTGVGRVETFQGPSVHHSLAPKGGNVYMLAPGGYVAVLPSTIGLPAMVFNADDKPIRAIVTRAFSGWWLGSPKTGPCKAGERFDYRYLAICDPLDEPAVNTRRIESLRHYFGLTGENGSGIQVKRGKLLSHRGIIELEPHGGVVEFEVPNPGWRVNLPLGIRVRGLNPNWTVGQLQVEGYSQRFYTGGRNVWRQLGPDDRGLVHLAVYPDHARRSHHLVGHPVQCDAADLIIQVTKLSDKPVQYHVAVNNPTDKPIHTTLRRCMDLPGFTFPDTPLDVPAGAYIVVKKK